MNRISVERLDELLRYEPISGKIFHKTSRGRVSAGQEVGGSSGGGYRRTRVDGVTLLCHRVAWALHFGEWPNGEIDHVNQIRTDNRIQNLRVVQHHENMKNMRRHVNNRSGITGVRFKEGRWLAHIGVGGRTKHLGTFFDAESAARAREKAEREYGFSEIHGK